MNLVRTLAIPALAIPALAVGATVTGAPAAQAATSSNAVPANSSWYTLSNYPTYIACNAEGYYLEVNRHSIQNYRCLEEILLNGYTTVWVLQYQLGQVPGG
jgi:hypothetical protein